MHSQGPQWPRPPQTQTAQLCLLDSVQVPMRKKKRSRYAEQQGGSEPPQCGESPVLFTREDQCFSSAATGMVSFGSSDDKLDYVCGCFRVERVGELRRLLRPFAA
ncbi:hypothetical protein DPX16_14574 [Anabarilius grahami]|uniref:Uncharacterized protein n=1 Tax=Anabarilius grahami TaxID=495550 RepID=A0A3N0YYK1_ANAGA|nr:hypothetical protein DPX16_14574 [Anabarilius grahami]